MNKHKNHTNKSRGFGIQMDITEDGAVVLLHIVNPRRLNTESLGRTLMKFFQGGYKTIHVSTGKGGAVKMDLLSFIGRLAATYQESRYRAVERRVAWR